MSSNQIRLRRSSRLSPSPLINLNPEIWRLILKKLTRKEAKDLRLVNKDFKLKVDNLYEDWCIWLDEDSPYFVMMLDLRVKEVDVQRLVKQVPSRPPGVIFTYPDLITKLTVNIDEISRENLHILLQCKNLKDIKIEFELGSNNEAFWQILDPRIGFNFPQLQNLFLLLPNKPGKLLVGGFYERLMTLSVMPNLRSLTVSWKLGEDASQAYVYRYASTLLKFLGRHGQTLKQFICCSNNGEFSYTGPSFMDQKALLQNCSNLETFEIYSICDSSDVLYDTLKELIQIQSKLKEIQISHYNRLVIPSSLCAKVIANNYETLVKVVIEGIRFEAGETRFDMSIFAKCLNLRYLKLKSVTEKIGLLNLHTLPKQMETIVLHDFFISTQDFSSFLKHFNFLTSISILGVRRSDQFILNLSILEIILKHTSLKYVTLSPFPLTNSPSERDKMNEMYARHVSGNVTNYFNAGYYYIGLRLKKNTDSNATMLWAFASIIK